MSGGWKGSTRRDRLPADWRSKVRPAAAAKNPMRICHMCGKPGGDAVDHIRPGDDHSIDNLDWVHQDVPPYCHRKKSSAEGHAARVTRNNPPEPHPALS